MALPEHIVRDLWFTEDAPDARADASARSFAAKVAELEGLKPFPAAAQRVLSLLANPDFRVQDVRVALEEDPALAGRVLRVANSATFAGSNPVDTVGRAVIRLGAGTVREIVIAMTTMGLFDDVTGRGRLVREHCVATGAIARVIGRDFVAGPTVGLFLAGLMHDVGKLLLMQGGEFPTADLKPEELEEIDHPGGSHPAELRYLGYDHAVLGGHAVLLWKIPYPTPQVVAWHHQPDRGTDEEGDEMLTDMIAVLRVANVLDRLLVSDPPLDKGAVKDIVRMPESQRLGISVKGLLHLWSELFLAKAESSSLFV